ESERAHVAELVELDRVKTELVDIVTHELRTPLTAVLAASEGVQRPELRENHAELIHIIDQNAHYLAAMIEDLVISTRLEPGRAVTIEAAPTGGCAFKVELPACPPSEAAAPHEAAPSTATGRERGLTGSGRTH